MDVSKSVIAVTGGASGLGEATCRYFLERGAQGVVAMDMNAARGEALAGELGERFLFVETDVSDEAAVEGAVEAAIARFGGLHVAIAAAAIGLPARLLSSKGPIQMAKFDKVIRVNLYGALHLMRSAAAAMAANEPNGEGERGVLIAISSGAAYEGQVGQVAYSASKAALVGMTLPLMRELSELGIRVVTVAPGAFDTPIYEQVPKEVREGIEAVSLFPPRLGKASEFAMFAEEIVRNPMHNGRSYRFDAGLYLPAKP